MNLSIIIPNYNGAELLKKNLPKVLESVREYNKGYVEIIIPDDPSTDRSREVINNFINSIKETHIQGRTVSNINKKEAGFTKNVRRGVLLATGDILILLNHDVAPHKNFLKPLLKHFEDGIVFAVGCMHVEIENGEPILQGRGIGKWQRGFLTHQNGELTKANTFWVSCNNAAFRKNMWDRLGGLDPLYNPQYWEDLDLSYRALKAGYKLVCEPESIVTYQHEKGVVKAKSKIGKMRMISYRNQFIFVWKNITQQQYLISHFLWLPYHFMKAIISRDWKYIAGFYAALALLPQIQRSRYKSRKISVRKDSDIFKKHAI